MSSFAHSVFVTGNDVYVAGEIDLHPVLWKNSAPIILSTDDGEAYSVLVAGNDVYVTGYIYNYNGSSVECSAILWKNGVPDILQTTFNNYFNEISVFLFENDIYVVGYNGYVYDEVSKKSGKIVLWKNGVQIMLTDGVASAVYVTENDVYVAGAKTKMFYGVNAWGATLWKNGIPTTLTTDEEHYSSASCVCATENDVYVAGTITDRNNKSNAVLWKNGVPTILSEIGSVSSIYVVENDVYLIGCPYTGSAVSVWKNGIQTLTYPNNINKSNGFQGVSHSVYLIGNDIYAAGAVHRVYSYNYGDGDNEGDADIGKWQAALWKNGVMTFLPIE